MLDLAKWVSRGIAFANDCRRLPGEVDVTINVLPPLSVAEANDLAQRLPHGLPAPMWRFLTEGASRCEFHYCFTPPPDILEPVFPDNDYVYGGPGACDPIYGSPGLCSATKLADYQQEAKDNAENFDEYWGDEGEANSKFWHRCVPFLKIVNGDHLALDMDPAYEQPPVRYLHYAGDGTYPILARGFDEFLES